MLISGSPAAIGDIAGRATVIDGDTIEIHGTRIRLWGLMRPKAINFAVATTASLTGAVRSPPQLWQAFPTPSLDRSFAF